MKRLGFIITIIMFFAVALQAQTITASQILSNMKARFNTVNDYTAEVEANVNMEKLRMPKVKIKMYFKQPDKFHYESKSFAMLPKGGVNFNPLDYPEDKFNYKLNGKETINEISAYQLEVTPKEKKKDAPDAKTFIWVDSENWVVKRVVNEKDEIFKIIMDFNHSWIEGKYYMPSWIKISYDVKPQPETESSQEQKPQKRSRGLKIQKGEISMSLMNYVINAGINDDIFKKTDEKK